MLKRLLFVDDEAMILNGLRRALHGMRSEWEMHFVDNAADALQALDQQAYDAIVTDMRMPMMDGAQLLEAVKQRHPEMIRMVLSGQSSRAAVLRSISPGSSVLCQSLAIPTNWCFGSRKRLPCAISLESIPQDDRLALAIDPEPAHALRGTDGGAAFGRSVSRANRTHHFEGCGMAAKILQLANSAFIGARGRVSSLLQAVSLIGTETVRTLVLSVHVFSQCEEQRNRPLPAGALGSQRGGRIPRAAHRHFGESYTKRWRKRVLRQDCCTTSGRWFFWPRCSTSIVPFLGRTR